jgi:hypothetical protein
MLVRRLGAAAEGDGRGSGAGARHPAARDQGTIKSCSIGAPSAGSSSRLKCDKRPNRSSRSRSSMSRGKRMKRMGEKNILLGTF